MEIQNRLAQELVDYKLDVTNNLVRPDTIYEEQAKDIKAKLDAFPIVLLQENAGSGKSRTVGEFSKIIADDNMTTGNRQRIVFATNTRVNRNAFAEANDFTIILGISEMVEQVAGKEVANLLGPIYDELDEGESIDIAKRLYDDGEITYDQLEQIRYKITANKAKLKANLFVAMTVAKIQVGEFIKTFSGYYVFLDEMSYDKLIHVDGEQTVYNSTNKIANYEVDKNGDKVPSRVNVNTFFENLATLSSITRQQADIHAEKAASGVTQYALDNTKLVLLSAEKSLTKAFESIYAPKTRYAQAGRPITLVDDNLTILYVKSTSNPYGATKQTNRARLAEMFKKYDYEVIADGADESKKDVIAIGDYTFEGAKGHNDMMDKNLVTIISLPHVFDVSDMMSSLGVDENTAISIICSDRANQAIGRNTGYRSRGAKHILIIPQQLSLRVGSERLLTLDTISNNVYDTSTRSRVQQIPAGVAKDVMDELFRSDQYVVQQTAAQLIHLFRAQLDKHPDELLIQIQAKVLKEALKQILLDIGVGQTRADKSGLVSKVISQLVSLGVIKKNTNKGALYVFTKELLLCLLN